MTPDIFLRLWFAVHMLAAVPALQPVATGYVTPAAEGVYERVLERRIRWEQIEPRWGYIPDCLCALNANHVGRYVVVFYPDRPAGEKHARLLCLTVDVAQLAHAEERERFGLVLEVDWRTWKRWGRGPVVVALLEEAHGISP